MSTRESGDGDYPTDQRGWLNLNLAPYAGRASKATKSQNKVYICRFCKKKFYNSKALGGHQNGHRKEKHEARRNLLSPNNAIMNFSHNLLFHHSPGIGDNLNTNITGDLIGGQHNNGEESLDLMMKWTGSYNPNHQPAAATSTQQSYSNTVLDLNLKL
uniref:uncharacterized protein LOC122591849 n=1 Tax=Erigeron canadensis TaxID=72917 RepID=UPI001CB8BF7F|nr:uncharacterized protein LOC122591849 [Erigeron canadensis]